MAKTPLNEMFNRRFLFSENKKTSTTTRMTTEKSSSGHSFSDWLHNLFTSGKDQHEENSNSLKKLALLKKFLLGALSSHSSSSPEHSISTSSSSKLDKLFEILALIAQDDKNQVSSSSNKLDVLITFLEKLAVSLPAPTTEYFQLALKLLNLAQGHSGLSSISTNDIKFLLNFIGYKKS